MHTTIDFVQAVKAKTGALSDNKVSKVLGVTRISIHNYQNKKSVFDEKVSLRVAHILQIAPAYVLACVNIERAKCTELKEVWEEVARKFSPDRQTLTRYPEGALHDAESADDMLCKVPKISHLFR